MLVFLSIGNLCYTVMTENALLIYTSVLQSIIFRITNVVSFDDTLGNAVSISRANRLVSMKYVRKHPLDGSHVMKNHEIAKTKNDKTMYEPGTIIL